MNYIKISWTQKFRNFTVILTCVFVGCPNGWLAGPDSCYLMPNKTTTQRKFAVNKCKNFGGHLVNIETEAENNFLSVLFSDFAGGRWDFPHIDIAFHFRRYLIFCFIAALQKK